MGQHGASSRIARKSLISRFGAWLFESLAAYGAFEAGALVAEYGADMGADSDTHR